MRRRLSYGSAFVALTTLLAVRLTAAPLPVQAATAAGPPPTPAVAQQIETATDGAKAKLDPKLETRVKKGDTQQVAVFATVKGDAGKARALLDNPKTAQSGDTGIVIGTIGVQALPKLATTAGVISVQPVEFDQDRPADR